MICWRPGMHFGGEVILICRFLLAGMILGSGMHPDLIKMAGRDDFRWGNWSWFAGKVLRGWFLSSECILIHGKSLAGMILSGGMHLDLREVPGRECILGHGEHPYPKNSKKWKNYLQFENSDDTIRFAVRENRISQDNNFSWIWNDFQENEKSCWQERDHMIFYQSCCWGTRSNNKDLSGRNTSKDVRKILNQIVTIK